jgi:GT2 family glycosyltransferase
MDPQPAAPSVVAVVVTHDAGPWLEEALAGLGAQDYPAFSVLVIDAASATDPTPCVAAVLPGAYIRRLGENPGYGATTNEVLRMVEGASFLVLCHDDIAPAPDAIRLMVEEALRSNAGIVGPKLVAWDDPERLLQVGLAIDRTGTPSPLVDRGELDQAQHDSVRDVFAVPGACTLVRADLFAELGGFDAAITFLGDDVDLCWRAQVLGARVVVAPQARVRHREALADRRPHDDRRRLQTRHRLRSLLTCYGALSLVRRLPLAILTSLAEIVYALAAGRRAQAVDVASAWTWNLNDLGTLRRRRRDTQRRRRVPDRDIARLQSTTNPRLRAFLRGADGSATAGITDAGRELLGTVRTGPRRAFLLTWIAIVAVLLVGSRDVVNGRLTALGQFAPFPEHATTFIRHFLSGWRFAGLGSEQPAPTAFAILGFLGSVLLGGMGLLQKILTLGAIPIGIAGAWRLARPLTGSTGRARLVAPVVYAAMPLAYNAFAGGHWAGLVAYAVLPYALARLLAATGLEPWGGDARPLRDQVIALGLLTAIGAALAPTLVVLIPLVAVGLVVGSVLAGALDAALRALAVAVGASIVAAVLCFPWVLTFVLPGSEWSTFAGVEHASSGRFGALLRFQTGPLGAPPIGWAFLVAAVLPLLIGREWRLAWAIRLWFVALASFGTAWIGARGWSPVPLPEAEVVLAPAAIALTLATALGLIAFELDLPFARFGWRQVASLTAAAAVVVGTIPVLGAALGGRWHLPHTDYATSLAWMHSEADGAAFRVLWVGDARALPLDGWDLGDGLAYGVSRDGTPTALDLWPPSSDGATRLLPDALRVARAGGTTRLGRLLAPMGVRYIVVPSRAAPDEDVPRHRPPPDLDAALAAQLDLKRLQVDPSATVYQNVAAAPLRAALPAGVDATSRPPLGVDLSGATPVMPSTREAVSWNGDVPNREAFLSEASSSNWRLNVNGEPVTRRKAFGWANSFANERTGNASLGFRTPFTSRLLLLVELALWVLAIRWALRHRRALQS